MFTGEYRHSVDDKGRLAVPSRFRAQLDAGLVVSRWLDACLAIHTKSGWDALAEKGVPEDLAVRVVAAVGAPGRPLPLMLVAEARAGDAPGAAEPAGVGLGVLPGDARDRQAQPVLQRPRPAADDDDDDDDKPGRERRKIEIKFIQDKSRRHITFSKRKAGIMKKVRARCPRD